MAETRAEPDGGCRHLSAGEDAAGERLDRYLSRHLDEPRNQIQRWIRDGRVTVDGVAATKPSSPLAGGEELAVTPPPPEPVGIEPEEGRLHVLHEDPALIVLDKPAGLTVHPGAGRPTGTLVHRLLDRYPELAGVGGPGRPGIVHRLDKDTSGVLVIARTVQAYRALQRAFSERQVEKRYLTLVYGTPHPRVGTIDEPIGRHPRERKRMTTRPDGRRAITHFRTVATAPPVALLEIDLATGRTHQIRVHLKARRHPIVGDPVYGEARWKEATGIAGRALETFPRPALHAWRIAFGHPESGRRVAFEAPVPEDMTRLWEVVAGAPFPEVTRDWTPSGSGPE